MHVFLHHLFTPHHTNNHRARALHIDALFVYVLLFAIFNVGFRLIYRFNPDILGYATDIRMEQLLQSTNAKRQQAGLAPLRLNATLSDAAAHKAMYMFQKNFWAHVAPDGKTPWDFILGSGYQYTMAGENLAKNFSTSNAVVDAWMGSQSHRENLLKPGYQDVGFAVVNGVLNGEETTLVVQMFGATKQLATITQPAQKPEEVKPQVLPETKPVVLLNETSPASVAGEQPAGLPGFIMAFRRPMIDLPTASRTLAFIFGGFMISVLLVDGYLVFRRRIVRVSGHSVAHILFLTSLFIGMSAVLQGAIL